MSAIAAAGALFKDRRMAVLSGTAAIGRWQDSMTVLALLLGAHAAGLSLGQASLCTAVMALAAGISSTPKARWMDRRGPRVSVGALSIATGLGYVLLIGSLMASQPMLVAAAAALLGASRTNSGMCMQVTWMSVLKEEGLRARAVSWESLVTTLMQNTGPLLVSALVALYSPVLALVVCGAATSASMWVWSRSSVHAQAKPQDKPRRALSWNIGWGVLAVAGVAMMINILMGSLQVVLVGSSGPAMAAIMNAALAAGAGAASLYSLGRGFPMLSRLSVALASGVVILAVALPLAGSISGWIILPLLLACGVVYGLATAAIALLLQKRAPEGRRAEAFSWRLTLSFIGLSLGQAAAGQIISILGLAAASLALGGLGVVFVVAACAMLGLIKLPSLPQRHLAMA